MSQTLLKEDGDIYIDPSSGRPQLIAGIRKLSQDVADALTIEYDASRDFGQELTQVLIANAGAAFLNVINAAYIKNRVEEAIARLKSVQQSRPDQMTDYELIDKVRDLRVYAISNTNYVFTVTVEPKAGPDQNPQTFSVKLAHQLP